MQMRPADALALAANVLALAKGEGWTIRPDFLELVEQIQMSGKKAKH
jgi:hypothetical protein